MFRLLRRAPLLNSAIQAAIEVSAEPRGLKFTVRKYGAKRSYTVVCSVATPQGPQRSSLRSKCMNGADLSPCQSLPLGQLADLTPPCCTSSHFKQQCEINIRVKLNTTHWDELFTSGVSTLNTGTIDVVCIPCGLWSCPDGEFTSTDMLTDMFRPM
ncbi:hypothetical protein N7468_002237 [Penicillium chermesinum]|uniref:Uncharacterized protein n=1 Tax=Penicillium chermesinum TaxID=63820 RepID=A0A9W9TZE0_9EURO|nr:uncharacterized protein N7468_002237 [Penicillium chermesinum]KAJ5247254.1 hypothetical protein N7468_002237 [Penicillium chermesinum]